MEKEQTGITVKVQPSGAETPSTLPDRTLEKVLWHINTLRAFPLNDLEINTWANTLRQDSTLDIEAVAWLINEMKWGRVEFDNRIGIQNITYYLSMIEKTTTGYRIKSQKHWPG